jgi:hypothetical protein
LLLLLFDLELEESNITSATCFLHPAVGDSDFTHLEKEKSINVRKGRPKKLNRYKACCHVALPLCVLFNYFAIMVSLISQLFL